MGFFDDVIHTQAHLILTYPKILLVSGLACLGAGAYFVGGDLHFIANSGTINLASLLPDCLNFVLGVFILRNYDKIKALKTWRRKS